MTLHIFLDFCRWSLSDFGEPSAYSIAHHPTQHPHPQAIVWTSLMVLGSGSAHFLPSFYCSPGWRRVLCNPSFFQFSFIEDQIFLG